MRFSAKLSLLITTILLSSLCAMFYFGYTSTTRIVEQSERERLEGLAFQVIDKIDRMLFERRADMGVLATDLVIGSKASTPEQLGARLNEFKRQYRLYSSLSYFTTDRIRIADTSGRDIGKRHPPTSYWREIAGNRDRVMTIDEAQTTKEITINFAATVKDDRGRRVGVVVARLPIESVRHIADQSIQNGGGRDATELELLDANGLILYSSYRRPGMLREQSGDWVHIRGLLAGGESVGSVRHAYEGEDELTAFAREKGYDTFKGNGWVLTLCVPAEDIFAVVNEQAKKFSLLFAGIGAAVVMGTLLLSRTATKPLYELSRAAAAIGRGGRDVSVRVRSRDEIGQLAQAFNRMALELKESEGRFKEFAEMLPQVVYEIDTAGKVLFVNYHGLEIFGYTQHDIEQGVTMLHVVAPGDHGRLLDNTKKALSGEKIENVEFTALRKDKSAFPFLVFLAPVMRDGRVVGMRGMGIDITARKQTEGLVKRLNEELEQKVRDRTKQLVDAQEELVRKEKLAVLGQIAGSVGHELRNPLGVMNNAVYYLQMVLAESDDTVREYLDIIKNEIRGAERIVSDLLDAVRTKPPQRQSVQVDELLSMSLDKCCIPDHITVLVGSVPQRAVLIDPRQMKQVFINLITNATEAMPKGGRLTLGAEGVKGGVRFTFKDEGTGIAPENRDKIFQPLFTTKARGIGLGLVVVKNLTEANAGTVVVESETGKGAVFTVTLPAAEA